MADATQLTALHQQWFNQGIQHLEAGQWAEAQAVYRRILAERPDVAEAHYNLSGALKRQGKLEEAVAELGQAVTLRPGYAEAWNNLGLLLRQLNRTERAIAAFRQALATRPNFPEACNNLGNTLRDSLHPIEAIQAFRQAVTLRNDYALAWNGLAVALREIGELDDAIACFDRGLALQPDDLAAAGARLCTLHFHDRYDAPAIYREARRCTERFNNTRPPAGPIPIHANDPAPERRLRIGYVSSDLRRHGHSLFMMPLLAHHDHRAFEIFCYAGVANPDAVTARLRRHADGWRDIARMNDEQVTQLVRQDKIDILVDLTLHMAGRRLNVFARKAAPVQVTWLGYPGTTGLDAIDYRLTDPRLDPPNIEDMEKESGTASEACTHAQSAVSWSEQGTRPGQDTADSLRSLAVPLTLGTQEPYYSERSVRLPDTFWCYDPRGIELVENAQLPEPGPLPALTAGRVTFGCLNNFFKVTDRTLALWAGVLAALPGAQLILLAPPGQPRERVLQKLGLHEGQRERIKFVYIRPRKEYLETYRQIDLCLDTLPYNGHTTSLDSLWMGVPVLTRVGQTVVGRAGWSQLHNLGLTDLVARSDEEFVKLAVEWTGDLERLARLRAELRGRMERSPLMDGARFARNMEDAYRSMWRAWCRGRG